MPKFSIIIPFHNSASTLGITLHSLQAQICPDWEAICIDDHGTDTSAVIARSFAATDPRIKVMENPGNGPSDARNYGAAQATGKYLAFLDADDIWTPTKLATLKVAFDTNTTDAHFARVGFFSQTPDDCKTLSTVPARSLCISDLLAENPVCTLSNLTVKKEVFNAIGGFDPDIIHNEDLEFLIRVIGEGYTVRGQDCVLTWYRTNANGLSSDMAAMSESRRRVMDTAFRYGVTPTRADDAIYMRYLARRALRLNAPHKEAWSYTKEGLRLNARHFLTPLRRGGATALAALAVRICPRVARLLRT